MGDIDVTHHNRSLLLGIHCSEKLNEWQSTDE
jgi:hypothetical protein